MPVTISACGQRVHCRRQALPRTIPSRRLDHRQQGHQPVGEHVPRRPARPILRRRRRNRRPSPSSVNAQARGERKPSAAGSASANSAAAQRRATGLASLRAHSPSAQSARPWLSSEPLSSSQRRSKPMKLRNRLVSGFQACCTKAASAGRQNFGQALLARIVERAGHQQRAGVVVDAIAVRAIRHRMHRVLKQAGVVAHRQEMAELHAGRRACRAGRLLFARRAMTRSHVPAPRAFEGGQVALRNALPGHRPAARIGALAHRAGGRRRSARRDFPPIAVASPNGTRTPRPSASNSRACQ
jgi:hypothetical protein